VCPSGLYTGTDGGNHRKHSPGRLRFAVCHLYKAASAIKVNVLPAQREHLAWAHSRSANEQRSISPRLRAIGEVPFPFSENAIPLPLPFRKGIFAGRSSFPHSKARLRARRRLRSPQLIREAERPAYFAANCWACWSLILSRGRAERSHLQTILAPSA
jgi:hypothetical protein